MASIVIIVGNSDTASIINAMDVDSISTRGNKLLLPTDSHSKHIVSKIEWCIGTQRIPVIGEFMFLRL